MGKKRKIVSAIATIIIVASALVTIWHYRSDVWYLLAQSAPNLLLYHIPFWVLIMVVAILLLFSLLILKYQKHHPYVGVSSVKQKPRFQMTQRKWLDKYGVRWLIEYEGFHNVLSDLESYIWINPEPFCTCECEMKWETVKLWHRLSDKYIWKCPDCGLEVKRPKESQNEILDDVMKLTRAKFLRKEIPSHAILDDAIKTTRAKGEILKRK